MLRGAHKQMIVVRTRDSRLFEEAHFVMRRGISAAMGDDLDLVFEANRIIENSLPRTLPREGARASGRPTRYEEASGVGDENVPGTAPRTSETTSSENTTVQNMGDELNGSHTADRAMRRRGENVTQGGHGATESPTSSRFSPQTDEYDGYRWGTQRPVDATQHSSPCVCRRARRGDPGIGLIVGLVWFALGFLTGGGLLGLLWWIL